MNRREFFRSMAGKGAAIGVAAFAGTGCRPDHETEKKCPEIVTEMQVPVIRHVVQKNEGFLGLAKREFRETNKFGRVAGYTYEDEFLMRGGNIGRENVVYRFRLWDVLNGVNPGLNANMGSTLKRNQEVMFPDFSNDGSVGGIKGEKIGYIVFTGVCDCNGRLVRKGFEYKPLASY